MIPLTAEDAKFNKTYASDTLFLRELGSGSGIDCNKNLLAASFYNKLALSLLYCEMYLADFPLDSWGSWYMHLIF